MKTQKLLLSTLFLLFSFIGFAQNNLTLTGQISPVTSPISVNLLYSDSGGVYVSSTFMTDSTGYFYLDTIAILGTQGYVEVTFSDCNGTLIGDSGFYSPTPATGPYYDFGIIDYCLNGNNQTFVSGVFLNAPGVINYSLSLDFGATFQNFSTSPNGIFNEGFAGLTGQPVVFLQYTDCNGISYLDSAFNSSSSATQEIFNFSNLDYCANSGNTTFFNVEGQFVSTSSPVVYTITYDDNGFNTLTGISNSSGVFNLDSIVVNNLPDTVFMSYTDCNGSVVNTFALVSPIAFPSTFEFGVLNYCNPVSACTAGFTLNQNIIVDSLGNIISTGNVLVTNTSVGTSTGTNLTYTWDFGDGSATYTGVNFTHTYASNGPFNLCLTIDDGANCVNTYCDSVMVNANGVLSGKTNEGFTIQTGDGSDNTNGPNGIDKLETGTSFSMYPNPASEFITIAYNSESKEDAQLIIFNITGKVMLQKELNVSNENLRKKLDISNLNKGVYIVQFKTPSGLITKTLSVK